VARRASSPLLRSVSAKFEAFEPMWRAMRLQEGTPTQHCGSDAEPVTRSHSSIASNAAYTSDRRSFGDAPG
jgi:hypothetical protein